MGGARLERFGPLGCPQIGGSVPKKAPAPPSLLWRVLGGGDVPGGGGHGAGLGARLPGDDLGVPGVPGGGSGVGLSPPRGSLAREIWGGGLGGAERWSRGGPRLPPGAARAPFGVVPLGSQAPQEEIIITIIIIIITKKEKTTKNTQKKKDLNRQVRFPEQRN